MFMVDTALAKRVAEGRPIRVGMIGAGYSARQIASQIVSSFPGIHLAAIANRTAANTSPTIVGEEGTRDFTRTATTDRIAEGSASVAWWTFVVMALSAGAAVLGGAMGPRSGEMQRRLA